MSNNQVSWILSDNTITVSFDGRTHMLPRTDAYAPKLIDALKSKRYDEVPQLVSAALRIEKFSEGKFQVRDGEILVDGVVAPTMLGRKIKEFANQGLPYEPLVKFARNLQRNPSKRAVEELFQFLEKNQFPITEDGHFIAWKKVREDFKDVHSGKFDNSPGQVLSMPRVQVDEDRNRTCSSGYHAASWDYAVQFYAGGKMMEVKIDPADVVAVPSDYNNAKLRTCRYEVLAEVQEHSPDLYRSNEPRLDYEVDGDGDEDLEERCVSCGDFLMDNGDEYCEDCLNEEEVSF